MWQEIVHLMLLYGCLILSFLNRKRTNSKLYIYFVIVCILETVPHFSFIQYNRLYSYGTLFCILFFTFYYSRHLLGQKNIIYALGLFSFYGGLMTVFNSEQTYSLGLAIIFCTFYIILSLLYFFSKLQNGSNVFIIKKEAFWVSTALLFWSIFFLFRVLPMYWLEENDIAFLAVLNSIFKVATIVTYVFFLIAVTRKY